MRYGRFYHSGSHRMCEWTKYNVAKKLSHFLMLPKNCLFRRAYAIAAFALLPFHCQIYYSKTLLFCLARNHVGCTAQLNEYRIDSLNWYRPDLSALCSLCIGIIRTHWNIVGLGQVSGRSVTTMCKNLDNSLLDVMCEV